MQIHYSVLYILFSVYGILRTQFWKQMKNLDCGVIKPTGNHGWHEIQNPSSVRIQDPGSRKREGGRIRGFRQHTLDDVNYSSCTLEYSVLCGRTYLTLLRLRGWACYLF